MTEKMANTSSSSTKRSPKATAAAAAALSTMIALNVCPVQAFQPTFLVPSARMMHRSPALSSTVAPAAVRMDCTPWDLECYGVHPLAGVGGLQRRRRMQQQRPGFPPIFAPANVFQDSGVQTPEQLVISGPTVVQDTADLYTLAFDFPAEVDQDGLEVSVSGRLLTVKARMTREESTDPSASRSGWVRRSSRTDSVSRSFVLPEGLSTSSATASLLSDGRAEVKFTKDKTVGGAAAGDSSETAAPPTADSAAPENKTAPSAEHVASSSSAPPTAAASAAGGATTTGGDAHAAGGTAPASPPTDAPSPAAERPPSRPESLFEVLDQEFLEFAKAMWGEEMLHILRVPTQEELGERAEAVKEARAKRAARIEEMAKAAEEARAKREAEFAERVRVAQEARAKRQAEFVERVKAAEEARATRVVAMRRATMASDISQAEDGSSYVVRVALPEGTAREDVKLTVNPDNSLRVTASAPTTKGGPSMYKNVFLPKDALTSEISAKFEAEESDGQEDSKEDGGVATGVDNAGAVSGVEVTVGRTIPPQPKSIEIL